MSASRDALEGILLYEGFTAAAEALRRGALRVNEVECIGHWGTYLSSGNDLFFDPQCERDYFEAPHTLPAKNVLP